MGNSDSVWADTTWMPPITGPPQNNTRLKALRLTLDGSDCLPLRPSGHSTGTAVYRLEGYPSIRDQAVRRGCSGIVKVEGCCYQSKMSIRSAAIPILARTFEREGRDRFHLRQAAAAGSVMRLKCTCAVAVPGPAVRESMRGVTRLVLLHIATRYSPLESSPASR